MDKSISPAHSFNIDFFRTILAQWVIIGHLGPELLSAPLVPGRVAVWGFFILSGYLNAKSCMRRFESGLSLSSVFGYYLSRIKRIYPLLFVNVLIVSIFLGTLLNADWYVFFPYMHSSSYQLSNSVLWTLVIEIQLYALTPLLFILLFRLKNINWRWFAFFCIGLLLLVPLAKVYFSGNHSLIDDRTVSGNIGFYLLGMMFSVGNIQSVKFNKKSSRLLLVLWMVMVVYFLYQYNVISQSIQFTIGPLITILTSFLLLNTTRPLISKWHAAFSFLGYYTYEIYVLHGLMIFVSHHLNIHTDWAILMMWWMMPIILVVIFDIFYKRKHKFFTIK